MTTPLPTRLPNPMPTLGRRHPLPALGLCIAALLAGCAAPPRPAPSTPPPPPVSVVVPPAAPSEPGRATRQCGATRQYGATPSGRGTAPPVAVHPGACRDHRGLAGSQPARLPA
jgi:hypothetical protein